VCITTNQSGTKSNPNPNHNANHTTKQQAVVNNQLNIVTWTTYPDKFTLDNFVATFVPTSVIIVTQPLINDNYSLNSMHIVSSMTCYKFLH